MNPGKLERNFIEFVHIHSCTGSNIAVQLESLLERLGLDINNIHDQGYDGAANMSGARSGAVILGWCTKGLYFHCSGHRLHLVVAFTCKLPSVTNMTDAMRKCSQIFEFSAKKQGLLEENIKATMPEGKKEFIECLPNTMGTKARGSRKGVRTVQTNNSNIRRHKKQS